MKLLIVLSALFLVAVIAAPRDSTSPGHHFGGKKHGGTFAPFTDEQKAQFEKQIQEAIAKLSPEAQAIAKQIGEIFKSKDKEAHKKIEALKAGASESVQKELKSIYEGHGKHHGHGKGGKRTTVKA